MAVTIVEFLNARLDEDEAVAKAAIADDCGQDEGFAGAKWLDNGWPGWKPPIFGKAAAELIRTFAVPARVLREVEAKRAIVDLAAQAPPGHAMAVAGTTLRFLAAVYADHREYDPAWAMT